MDFMTNSSTPLILKTIVCHIELVLFYHAVLETLQCPLLPFVHFVILYASSRPAVRWEGTADCQVALRRMGVELTFLGEFWGVNGSVLGASVSGSELHHVKKVR